MEALTISQANLNTIENNMQSVATELRGVIEHINEVNNRINNVENKVSGVNNDINNVVEEIRVNTILNNARQNIIYNNSIIEKKFGYYDSLRRKTENLPRPARPSLRNSSNSNWPTGSSPKTTKSRMLISDAPSTPMPSLSPNWRKYSS